MNAEYFLFGQVFFFFFFSVSIFCPQLCMVSQHDWRNSICKIQGWAQHIQNMAKRLTWLTWCAVSLKGRKGGSWCCGSETELLIQGTGLYSDSSFYQYELWRLLNQPCLSYFVCKTKISIIQLKACFKNLIEYFNYSI